MAENVNITIKAFDKTKKGFGSVASGLKKVTGAVFSMRTALVGAAGLAGFGLLVKSSLSATDSLAKTASKIGTTTEALGALRYAADITGVATTTMDMALQRFTRRTAEAAKGTGEAKGAIRELGINAQELNRLPLDKRMLVLADAFSGVKSESDRLRLAFKLFDSEGAALVNTLSLGREGLSELLGEAQSLGIVMSSEAAAGVEATNDSLTSLKYLIKGFTDQTVAHLAEGIKLITDRFVELGKEINGGEMKNIGKIIAENIVTALKNTLLVMQGFINAMGKIAHEIKIIYNKFFPDADTKKITDRMDEIERKASRLGMALSKTFVGANYSERLSKENKAIYDEYQQLKIDLENLKLSEPFNVDLSTLINGLDDVIKTIGSVPKLKIVEEGELEPVITLFDRLESAFADVEKQFPTIDEGMKKIANSMSGAITKGFTDAITGAAKFSDAMKAMAKSVVDSLIEMLVQYYITQSIFGLITGTPFPTGGGSTPAPVVDAVGTMPSLNGGGFTGYGSRSGGVDGKGGFPAILHPNETIIDHTKGQSSGVVVQQTINVTTGVQQTVRAEIVQLMPQIAQAAKGAVADARLRGGNFSKAMAGA